MEKQEKVEKLIITLTEEQQKIIRSAFNLSPDAKCKYLGIKITDEILKSIKSGDNDGGTVVVYSPGEGGDGTVIA